MNTNEREPTVDSDLEQVLHDQGFRFATYGDMPLTLYVCKHGTIAGKSDEDHPCVWAPIIKE